MTAVGTFYETIKTGFPLSIIAGMTFLKEAPGRYYYETINT